MTQKASILVLILLFAAACVQMGIMIGLNKGRSATVDEWLHECRVNDVGEHGMALSRKGPTA